MERSSESRIIAEVEMLGEYFKTAMHMMRKNKMRTILSLLGIMIGVSSVVVILSIGGSASKNITQSFEGGAMDIITISGRNSRNGSSIFTEEFAFSLQNEFDEIDDVIIRSERNLNVRYMHENMSCSVVGTTSTFAQFYHLGFDSGNWFSVNDNLQSNSVCVIGSEVREMLFENEDPIGKYIKIFRNQAKSFMVVGVLEENDDVISTSSCVFVPYNTFTDRIYKSNTVGSYIVRVKSEYDPVVVSDKLSLYMDSLVSSDGYVIFSKATLIAMVATATKTVYSLIAAVGAISLLVGGIGIMNIMLVSVSERIREIGIRKALGATPSGITQQFIVESVVITGIAGILGIVFGTAVSVIAAKVVKWPVNVSFSSYLIGFVFSFVIGVVFGSIPARKAAKVDIVVSLSHE